MMNNDNFYLEIPNKHTKQTRLSTAFVPERSKGSDSSSDVFVLVGSNPTECNFDVVSLLNFKCCFVIMRA